MIIAYIFIYILEIKKFFNNSLINNLEYTHQVNILKVFLQSSSSFLKSFFFNNKLILFKNKFKYYTCKFAYCFVKLFLLYNIILIKMFNIICPIINIFLIRFFEMVLIKSFFFQSLFTHIFIIKACLQYITSILISLQNFLK